MKLSIIVPVYKVEPYLHRCVDSILAQTFRDFEVIRCYYGVKLVCPTLKQALLPYQKVYCRFFFKTLKYGTSKTEAGFVRAKSRNVHKTSSIKKKACFIIYFSFLLRYIARCSSKNLSFTRLMASPVICHTSSQLSAR